MQQFLPRIRKNRILEAALGLVVLHSSIFCAEEPAGSIGLLSAPASKGGKEMQTLPEKKVEHDKPTFDAESASAETYTINFENISIVEYIRFVSRISGQNFIFNEEELQFNVTIVSEDP